MKSGKIVEQRQLMRADGKGAGLEPSYGRFHATPDGELLVVCAAAEPEKGAIANYLMPTRGDPQPVRLELDAPFRTFFTATERGGSAPSHLLDLYGIFGGDNTVRYARIRLGK